MTLAVEKIGKCEKFHLKISIYFLLKFEFWKMSIAPALSTNQEEELFAKIPTLSAEDLAKKRSYLGKYSPHELTQRIIDYYSLNELAERLKIGKWAKIALQFPDDLIIDSAIISQVLKSKLPSDQQVWILADTSYSPCCIDTIAAEHSTSTHIVHFGDACLNPIKNISATYVLGKPNVDFTKLVEVIMSNLDDDDKDVCLMADACHSILLPELKARLLEAGWVGENLVIASLDSSLPTKDGQDVVIIDYETSSNTTSGIKVANRILVGVEAPAPTDEDDQFNQLYDQITQNYHLIHLTAPSDSRMLQLNTKFKCVTYIDPKSCRVSNKKTPNLMKRYKFMHEARSASTVGILLNTLSLSNTLTLVNTLVKWVHNSGKKHYLFVVGKPNVAKLANFECVDVWCVIGCGQNGIIIDQFNEYWKPMITPYELWLALADDVQWQGNWVVDFNQVLENDPLSNEYDEQEEETAYDSEEDAPQFNPVTGKLSLNKPLRQLKHLELELDSAEQNQSTAGTSDNAVVKSLAGQLAVKNTISLAAMHLQDRQWTGLGSDYTNEDGEAAVVEEGRTGIARDYIHDDI